MKLLCLKSKRTGMYFRFREYCDDGYGELVANQSFNSADSLPTFFDNVEQFRAIGKRDHEDVPSEIEIVEVEININPLEPKHNYWAS